jgi:hypothetical protein
VDEEAVYLCTGNPMPRDIQTIVNWLFNEPFQQAYTKIAEMQVGPAGACLGAPQGPRGQPSPASSPAHQPS